MKNKSLYAVLVIVLITASCKKSFIDRPSLDGTTLSNYYNTAEEVRGLTSTLYGLPWSGYENRAMDAIGDVMAGNEYTGGNDDPPFLNFSYAATSVRIADAWKVFYKIGGWERQGVGHGRCGGIGGRRGAHDPGRQGQYGGVQVDRRGGRGTAASGRRPRRSGQGHLPLRTHRGGQHGSQPDRDVVQRRHGRLGLQIGRAHV